MYELTFIGCGVDMAKQVVPYVMAYGNITKALNKIREASTPDRFTHDFLSSKLGLSARAVIPFLKRNGFLESDGTPTPIYKRFRNTSQSGAAAAEAVRIGFHPLYEINENAHELDDNNLKGLIVQATGFTRTSSTVRGILGSFKALKEFADFKADSGMDDGAGASAEEDADSGDVGDKVLSRIKFGYTINLHLPPTSDVAVFNAIFKSLREHLLK